MLRVLYYISRLSMIVRVHVFQNKTVVGNSDWRFDNLCDGHFQSQSELYHVSSNHQLTWYNYVDYVHPDDHTQPTYEMTPGFKPFTAVVSLFLSKIDEQVSKASARERSRSATTRVSSQQIPRGFYFQTFHGTLLACTRTLFPFSFRKSTSTLVKRARESDRGGRKRGLACSHRKFPRGFI